VSALVASLLSLFLGALLGGVAKIVQDRYASFQEGRAIAAALRAEIVALVQDFKDPGYTAMLDKIVQLLSDPNRVPKADDVLEMPVAQKPFQIFDGCCAKVGLLGDAVEPVVEAYGHAKSIEADLRFLPDRHRRQPLTRGQLLSVHQSIKTKSAAMVTAGELAMIRLRQQESRQFWLWQRKKTTS
jgi:hypothetical protein